MTADSTSSVTAVRRKVCRRRRQDKLPISVTLVLDYHIKGDVGFVSVDVAADLFPHVSHDQQPDAMCYVAISPWTPNAAPAETDWTVVPVTPSSSLTHSTIQFSPSSSVLQSFAATLQRLAPSKLLTRSGIEIVVLDVAPLSLETVFVSIESESTKRLEKGQGNFGPPNSAPIKVNGSAGSRPRDLLMTAIRWSLSNLKVAHDGDLFPLPLAPHPVTYTPPNPGKILLCEPVAQGILTETTKIVLMRGRVRTKHIKSRKSLTVNGAAWEDDESHTDHFYSAAEEGNHIDSRTDATETVTETETEMSDLEPQDEELSDDSMDEMISLQAPTLPPTTASAIGTMQPGTPMTIGTLRGRKTNGIASPASVMSTFTTAAARPDRSLGRLFKAQGLLKPISSELLHPKPMAEEDEEARIYVDMSSLTKIGCFSGDWVRIEAAQDEPLNGLGAIGLSSLGQLESEGSRARPARVYGLPEAYSSRPMTRIPSSKMGSNSLSFFGSQIQRPSSLMAYASPILLANLDNATHVRVSAIKRSSYSGKGRFTSAPHPPYARNIAIHSIRTPISTERAYQTAVLGGLKRYFARKIRLVKMGDFIAVPVDSRLGRALQEGPGSAGTEVDDVVALASSHVDSVAWFKVGHIDIQQSDEDEAEGFWGSVACIDSSTVGMHGTGSETSRIPGTIRSSWPYYLGLKKIPDGNSGMKLPGLAEFASSYTCPLKRQLRELLAAATSPRAIHLKMPPVAILLTSSHRNVGKATLARTACADIGLHTFSIDAYDILAEGGGSGSDVKTEGFLRTRSERAMSCGPDCCVLVIEHLEALTADRIESTLKDMLEDTRVLIATSNQVDEIPDGVRAIFTHELDVGAPDEAEREAILKSVIDDGRLSLDATVDTNSIALKTAALVAGDLVDVVERASVARQMRLEQLAAKCSHEERAVTVRDIQVAGGPLARCLTGTDFDVAVEAARKNFSDSIGAPKIPNVTWDDVGGLGNVKEAVTETIQLPLERPELFAKGMKKRSGILFYGPPGTGKTLLAKAIATEYSLNFFSVKGPELLNMYIGESEANVRRVFQRARDARPCVVFFDELDSVAPKRGNQGDSGGVMDRIVSQLLAELDGMSGGDDAGGVFVVGATNRPDLLDPALLRPGRFDKMLYLGVSDTHDKQLTILEALTRKFTLDPSCSLRSVAERLPFTYTGADLYALCSDAMLKAVTRQASAVDAKVQALNAQREVEDLPPVSTAHWFDHYASPTDLAVVVTEADFAAAQQELVPSVSEGELAHYGKVRAMFEGPGSDTRTEKDAEAAVRSGSQGVDMVAETNGGRRDASPRNKKKGKGKAAATSLDQGRHGGANGRADRKGNGKAVMGFQPDRASDDDGLY